MSERASSPSSHSSEPASSPVPDPPGVLDALAARFVGAAPAHVPPEADGADAGSARSAGAVRAMPVILRIERDPRPYRTDLLEAAAEAALAVCLDELAAPDGPWYDAVRAWTDGRIRKIARRARGSHWAAVGDLPGVTVTVRTAEVRALLPGPVDEAPREVSRLQIGGTELDPDEPGPPAPDRPLIVLNPAVGMSLGKAAAQVGHASMILAAVRGWTEPGPFAVRTATSAQWARLSARGDAVAVRDAGFTEVEPDTVTCLAV